MLQLCQQTERRKFFDCRSGRGGVRHSMTIATIDVGTNTVFMLVATIAEDGSVTPLFEEKRIVRVGEGVDATGRVGEAAIRRLCEALIEYRRLAQEYGATRIIVGATSASRDAGNQAELIA